MTSRAFVALGTNLGDRVGFLEFALRELSAHSGVRVVRCSGFHETQPVGGPAGQGLYLNAVVECECEGGARDLLAILQDIERRAGRVRAIENGPRTLDLDLLLFGELELDERDLVLPHPRLEERLFVLEPLAELAPEMVLRRSRVTVRERIIQLRG